MGLVDFLFKLREKRRLRGRSLSREIKFNAPDKDFPSNSVQTAKYNWLTFLPLNLLEQSTQLSNIYYAILSVLSSIPDITITDGRPVLAYALIVVVIFTMLKDLYEDRKRQVLDKKENNRLVRVFHNNSWVQMKNREVQVASAILIKENEPVPADILLIDSSNVAGICFIETSNLDGEANLKTKMVKQELKQVMNCQKDFEGVDNLRFYYDSPNQFIYKFQGKAYIGMEKQISLEYENFIPRGTTLRNTEWIKGVVLYTGNDTKIMLNSIHAKSKHSGIERVTKTRVLLLFVIQLVISLTAAIISATWMDWNADKHYYLRLTTTNTYAYNFFTTFGTWNLLIAQVPISIIIHLEFVRIFQAINIVKDKNMKTSSNVEASVQNSADIEELGGTNIIFSDKTGTLTKNEMYFKMISIGGILYGAATTESPEKALHTESAQTLIPKAAKKLPPEDYVFLETSSRDKEKVPFVDFDDPVFFQLLENDKSVEYNSITEALKCLGLCHTIVRDEKGNYNATSSDELALVNFAKYGGFEFMGTSKENINTWFLSTPKGTVEYTLLKVFEFSSEKKRMTTIFRNVATNEIILICKGAEEAVMRLISKDDSALIEKTYTHVIESSRQGYRTLVYSSKKLTELEYFEWEKKYKQGELLNGEEKKKTLDQLQIEIETNSKIITATIIEDKLQDNVKETLEFLRSAGIKVWMITGDNIETAMNISRSCGLVGVDVQFERFDEVDKTKFMEHVDRYLKTYEFNQLFKLAVISKCKTKRRNIRHW